jgi:putative nucleotidyltransferase with HDIG domain
MAKIIEDIPYQLISSEQPLQESNRGGVHLLCLPQSHQMTCEVMQTQHMKRWMAKLAYYDENTFKHSVDVAVYAGMLGISMNYDVRHVRDLIQTGLLHDIGKMQIPLGILRKSGRLTEEEYLAIQQHAQIGYEMLREEGYFAEKVLAGVQSHHENMDGSGYPRCLSEEQIPTYGSIIRICDVYDALTSKRPYKNALDHTCAIQYLADNAGSIFHGGQTRHFILQTEKNLKNQWIQGNSIE